MASKQKLIIVLGPTATGKTDVAVKLAREFNGEIVSADSMQVYRFMDIGTAKPSLVERSSARHHLIDIIDPDEDYNASLYRQDTLKAIEDIKSRGKNIIVAGGTGLYINILLYGLSDAPEGSDEIRERLETEAEEKGREYLHDRLKEVDPKSAENIPAGNIHRLIRALEVFEITGKPFSFFAEEHSFKDSEFDTLKIASKVCFDREALYERVNKRVSSMVQQGLEGEVQELLEQGFSTDLKSLNSLGYKEMVEYIKGETSLEEAVEKIKQNTRRYAKRQLTWFKRDETIEYLDFNDFESIRSLAESFLQKN